MAPSDAEISKHLQDILQSDEFASGFNDRVVQWLREMFERFGLWADGLGFWSRWAIVGVCLVLLAAIFAHVIYAVFQGNLPTHRVASAGASQNDALVTAAMLFERARDLADKHRLRDAACALQQAVLVHMCRERDIPWRASRADWEWVEILKPPPRAVAFIQSAQRLSFGPEPMRAGFDVCAQEAAELLRVDTRAMEEAAS